MNRAMRVGLAAVSVVVIGCLGAGMMSAQYKIPLVNTPPPGKPDKAIEAEQVEVHALAAVPSAIHRSDGEFILMLDNETRDPKAAFVLDPGDAGEGTLSQSPVLVYDQRTPAVKNRKAGFLDLARGTYYLKTGNNGHILCTITIE